MKNQKIYNDFTIFIKEYKQYFPNIQITNNHAIKQQSSIIDSLPTVDEKYIKNLKYISLTIPTKKPSKKLTVIKPKNDSTHDNNGKPRQLSNYQKLTQMMSSQKSTTTKEMFIKEPNLWHEYHNFRDFSFKGYDNQNEIPINKIIKYLETKSKHKLKILDLGCGRNLIKEHFANNNKFTIIGYDYVSYNGSIECDISNLPDEDESIKICVFSQSLMGSNWINYLVEGLRVLEYNGEMIISESVERYDSIKKYLIGINMKIIIDDYVEINRWFLIHAIKQ